MQYSPMRLRQFDSELLSSTQFVLEKTPLLPAEVLLSGRGFILLHNQPYPLPHSSRAWRIDCSPTLMAAAAQ